MVKRGFVDILLCRYSDVAFVPLPQWMVQMVKLDVTLGDNFFWPLAIRCVERTLVLEVKDLVLCP